MWFEKPIAPNPEEVRFYWFPEGFLVILRWRTSGTGIGQPTDSSVICLFIWIWLRIRAGEFELQHHWNTWPSSASTVRKSITHQYHSWRMEFRRNRWTISEQRPGRSRSISFAFQGFWFAAKTGVDSFARAFCFLKRIFPSTAKNLFFNYDPSLPECLRGVWNTRRGTRDDRRYQILILASIMKRKQVLPPIGHWLHPSFTTVSNAGCVWTRSTVIYGMEDFNGNLTRRTSTPTVQHTTRYGLPPPPFTVQGWFHSKCLYPANEGFFILWHAAGQSVFRSSANIIKRWITTRKPWGSKNDASKTAEAERLINPLNPFILRKCHRPVKPGKGIQQTLGPVVLQDLSWSFQGESWAVMGPMELENRLWWDWSYQIPYFQGSILRSGLKSGLKGIVKSFRSSAKSPMKRVKNVMKPSAELSILTVSDLLKAESAFKEEAVQWEAQNLIKNLDWRHCWTPAQKQWRNAENAAGQLFSKSRNYWYWMNLWREWPGSLQSFSSLISCHSEGNTLDPDNSPFNELVPEISHILCLKNESYLPG